MEYKLNQVVKITKPWSGSPFKEGEFAVIRGVFQTDSDCSVMYVLESMSNDYMYSLYPSEFTYVSYGDSIRAMSDEELDRKDKELDRKIEKLMKILFD